MRRRTLRDDAGVNLFPFMAVLICTVGALIMLLVVMVQQARVKASVPHETIAARKAELDQLENQRQATLAEHEKQKALAAKRQAEVEEFKWRADTLRSSYDATVEQLADERLKLSHMESSTRELEKQAAAMQAEANLIAQTAKEKVDLRSNFAVELDDLKNAIVDAKNELEQTKSELANLDPKYVLIPYKGPNGTDRRPIYIECLADRVILQPENVPLISEDFLEPLTLENPLARALRAKREFLQDNGLIGADSEPYPLLVVRPGAASTYAAARAAMKAWESEFGYELVESEVDLDYQKPDPRLRELLEDIVIETRGKRRMVRSMQTSVKPRRRERLRPSASGGFESVGGGAETFTASSSNSDSEFGDEGYGNTSNPYGGVGQGQPSRFETASNGTRGGGSQDGSELSFAGPNGSGSRFESNGQGGTSANGGPGEFGSPGEFGGANEFGQNRFSNNQFAQNGTGQNGAQTSSAQNGTDGPQSGQGGSESYPTSNNRFRSTVGQANPFRNAAASGDSAGGYGGTSATATGSGGKGTSGSGGASSNSASSSGGASAQMGATSSLSQNRGSNWAVPGLQQDAVGIQRPVYIACDAETIALLPERGTTQDLETFRHRGDVSSVVDAFVDSVQSRLESWGIAGQGIYWKPVLQVRVNANSDVVYQQLLHLLNDSGIEVTREP